MLVMISFCERAIFQIRISSMAPLNDLPLQVGLSPMIKSTGEGEIELAGVRAINSPLMYNNTLPPSNTPAI